MKNLPKDLKCGDWIASPPSKDISWRKEWRYAIFLEYEYGKNKTQAKCYLPKGKRMSTAMGCDEWKKVRRPKFIT